MNNIERLLRLVADYHKFCSDDYAKVETTDPDELSEEELDVIAAATGAPREDHKQENGKLV